MSLTTLAHCELRADGFSQEDKERFVSLFGQLHGDLNQTLEVAGISRATFYRHCEADPAFAESVRLQKVGVAWSLVPPLYARAVEKSDTAAIWLQKVLGGPEFNPERPSLSFHGPTSVHFPGVMSSSASSQAVVVDAIPSPTLTATPSSPPTRRRRKRK